MFGSREYKMIGYLEMVDMIYNIWFYQKSFHIDFGTSGLWNNLNFKLNCSVFSRVFLKLY